MMLAKRKDKKENKRMLGSDGRGCGKMMEDKTLRCHSVEVDGRTVFLVACVISMLFCLCDTARSQQATMIDCCQGNQPLPLKATGIPTGGHILTGLFFSNPFKVHFYA